MTKKEQEFMNKLVEENSKFRKLVRYTIEDISDLFWDYDRMSTSGQETLDRLSRMYAMKYEQETQNLYGGDHNALPK
jgi:hypothetical protein